MSMPLTDPQIFFTKIHASSTPSNKDFIKNHGSNNNSKNIFKKSTPLTVPQKLFYKNLRF